MSHLPNELFQMVLSKDLCSSKKQYHPRLSQLCGVSAGWRASIIATPTFWTQIHEKHPIPYIRLCVQRSGEAPLHIFADSSDRDPTTPPNYRRFPSLYSLIPSTLPRWETLHIVLGRYSEASTIDYLTVPTDAIRSLRIKNTRQSQLLPSIHEAFFGGRNPKIERLELDQWSSYPLLMFDATALTVLSLESVQYGEVALMEFLQTAPLLTHLTYAPLHPRQNRSDSSNETNDSLVTLPHLRYLNLKAEYKNVSKLVSSLDAPALGRFIYQSLGLHSKAILDRILQLARPILSTLGPAALYLDLAPSRTIIAIKPGTLDPLPPSVLQIRLESLLVTQVDIPVTAPGVAATSIATSYPTAIRNVTHLEYNSAHSGFDPTLALISAAYPCIKTVNANAESNLANSMMSNDPSLFPALEVLRMQTCSFSSPWMDLFVSIRPKVLAGDWR